MLRWQCVGAGSGVGVHDPGRHHGAEPFPHVALDQVGPVGEFVGGSWTLGSGREQASSVAEVDQLALNATREYRHEQAGEGLSLGRVERGCCGSHAEKLRRPGGTAMRQMPHVRPDNAMAFSSSSSGSRPCCIANSDALTRPEAPTFV